MRAKWVIGFAVAALFLAACGGGGDDETGSAGDDPSGTEMDGGMAMGEGDDTIDFGQPGDPADADREIRIEALDTLEFDPAQVEVDGGEVVTFVVTNSGSNIHEFTLGDEDFQMAHEEEMSMEGMGENTPYSVTLDPGETKELTWVFSESGEVMYGCHQPGHYEGGMVGTITMMN